jgi:SagB-type dehydrogenase family enzyme
MNKQIRRIYELTKFRFDKKTKKAHISPEDWPEEWKRVFYKVYPRFPAVDLNSSVEKSGELESLIASRRTTREFSNEPLDFEVVSSLIFHSAGISTPKEFGFDQAKRMYPSAGARYPIELYLVSNNIIGLERGIYHYDVKNNMIEFLLKKNLKNYMVAATNSNMGMVPAIIILSGVISRTEVKYGVNAYRFALLEAGHIGQNISLLSEKLNLGSCAMGGFDNDKISKLIDLTDEEIPLYIFAIGKKNEKK